MKNNFKKENVITFKLWVDENYQKKIEKPVKVRVTYQRETKYINLDRKILPTGYKKIKGDDGVHYEILPNSSEWKEISELQIKVISCLQEIFKKENPNNIEELFAFFYQSEVSHLIKNPTLAKDIRNTDINALVEMYINQQKNLSGSTIKNYIHTLNNFVYFLKVAYNGSVACINEDLITHYIEDKKSKGNKESSICLYVSQIIGFTDYLYKYGYIKKKIEYKVPFFYSEDEFEDNHSLSLSELGLMEQLVYEDGSKEGFTRDVFLFMVYGGPMRIFDALMFRTENVDIEKGIIRYVQNKQKRNRKVQIKYLSNKGLDLLKRHYSANRYFLFDWNILDKEGEIYKYEGLSVQQLNTNADYIKYKIRINSIMYMFLQYIGAKIGLKWKLGNHIAKKTYTELASVIAGSDIRLLQNMANHSDIKTTTEHYLKKDTEAAQKALNKMIDNNQE